MLFIRDEKGFHPATDEEKELHTFCRVAVGQNGFKYIPLNEVQCNRLHVAEGNSKTGKHVLCFNFPIELTCVHDCECYKLGKCYAQSGAYNFISNQIQYSENLACFNACTKEEFAAGIKAAIDAAGYSLFRWFTCGDIPTIRFFETMVEVARQNPQVEFWAYTKKYSIVNTWVSQNGDCAEALPANLNIVFSHWMNEDGSYYPMENPYNLPTSEFIPYGMEELIDDSTHVCPCSDPDSTADCEHCDTPCYRLKPGQKMALCEHSTAATKARDKELHESKKRAKAAEKAAKKRARKTA